ncbi:MAG: TonB-dependent receptor [Gemmatimonadota bacterium]|nr:TonB-dependent receptor [Gemmatimonadota bacterium]
MPDRYRIRSALAALLLTSGVGGAAGLAAQTGAVTGVVTDSATGGPLVEAVVDLVGTTKVRLTDSHGRFLIAEVPEGEYTVRVRMLGYLLRTAQVTVKAGSPAVADFRLAIDAVGVDPLSHPVGGPYRPGRNIGVSLPAIDRYELEGTFPQGGFGRILEGRIPGVRSIGTSGGIGAGRELRIRGTDSFGYTRQRPLVLVDGVRIDTNKEEWGAMEGVSCCFFSGGAGEDRLSDLNPEEIDRVEVLKGPAAAALYGAEGSAGVIRVFTGRGRTNTPASFTLNAGLGVNRLRANLPTRLRPGFTGPEGFPALDPNRYLIENGLINRYDLTVRGGGEDVTYFVAGGFAYEEGSVKPNDQRRANLRVNLHWTASQKIAVGVSSGHVRNRIWSLQSGNTWLGVYSNALGSDPRWASEEEPYGGGLRQSVSVADAKAVRTISDTDRWTGRVQVNYSAGADFTHRLTFGADRVWEQKTRDLPAGRNYNNVGYEGERNAGNRESTKYTLGFLSTYEYRDLFGTGFLTGSLAVGGQAHWDDVSTLMVTGRGFLEGVPPSIAAARRTFADDSLHDAHSRGVFVLNRLDFGEDLAVTAAVRVDDHSDFGEDVGARVYAKADVSYSVPQSVLPAPISRLRFRGAHGVAGKPPPPDGARRVYDVESRDSVTLPASRDRQPENKHEFEAGLDFGLRDDRIGVELTYYNARVVNALYPETVADPVVHNRAENVAEIVNRGLETAVSAWLIDGPAFGWNLSLAYEWNRNRITDLGPNARDDSLPVHRRRADGTWEFVRWRYTRSNGIFFEGESLDNIYGFGIASYDAVSNRHGRTDRPFIQGAARPTHMGLVSNSFRIGKELRVSFLFRGEVGASMQNWDRWWGVAIARSSDEYLKHLDDQGKPTFKADSVLDYHSIRVVDKRDHIRLQELSLSYTVPAGMAGMLGLGRTTVTLSGYNLHWWDACNCQDPNARYAAADTGESSTVAFMALPQPRRFLMSIRTRF